jgi:hypothetical protein
MNLAMTDLDENDFLADHGCSTAEEYDRKRFNEWVSTMEDAYSDIDIMDQTRVEEVDFKEVEHTKDLVKSLKKGIDLEEQSLYYTNIAA